MLYIVYPFFSSIYNHIIGCTYVETSLSGSIISPGYPVEYPPSAACKWTINSPPGTVVKLFFNDFYIEGTPGCKSDYLLLFDGSNSSSRNVGRYCNIAPRIFTSTSNSVHLEFYSDSSLSYRGFHAYYNTTPATTIKPTLPWKKLPRFVYKLLNKTVTEGSLVKLVCEVQGTPSPTITWKKDSENFTKTDHIVVDHSTLKSILTINNIAKSDQGMYTCVVYNGVGPAIKSNAWVTIKVRELPLIKKTTENRTVTVGSKVKLKCKANGPPPMIMRWIEKGKQLAENKCESSQDCRIELTIKIFENSVITCEVRNKAGRVTRNVLIKVKGPPLIIHPPQNKIIPAGLPVNFSCKAIGNPPVKISWLKDNRTVSYGVIRIHGRYILQFTAKKDSTVTCSARDQDGVTSKQAQLTVTDLKVPPKRVALSFIEMPENLNLEYKSTTKLKCQAKGFPEPELSWTKNDAIDFDINFTNGVSILTLKSIEETVTVSCIAKNAHEEIKSTATLTIISGDAGDNRDNTLALKQEAINNDMKLILGAVGGLLLLTIILIIFLLLRRRKNKKVMKEAEKAETTPIENENLISNPLFNSEREESDTREGIETLHFPREDIVHCEDIIDDSDCVKVFLGSATNLPFTTGEQKVFVKVLKDNDPSEEKMRQFTREASLLASLDHENVARLMAVCIQSTPLSLVFEYSEYGYLDEYLQDCDPSELPRICKRKTIRDSYTELGDVDRLSIVKQVAAGMEYLTEKGYRHQELRSRNCMVFKNLQIKVANLGLRWVKPEQNFFAMEPADKKRFPVRWFSPEVILYGEYAELADVWSYGVLVWEVFSDGLLPYTGVNDNDVVSYVRGGNILPRPKSCPQDVYEVLATCWEMTPSDRPNFASLFETMSALHAGVRV